MVEAISQNIELHGDKNEKMRNNGDENYFKKLI